MLAALISSAQTNTNLVSTNSAPKKLHAVVKPVVTMEMVMAGLNTFSNQLAALDVREKKIEAGSQLNQESLNLQVRAKKIDQNQCNKLAVDYSDKIRPEMDAIELQRSQIKLAMFNIRQRYGFSEPK
jgi:hypothetical protein